MLYLFSEISQLISFSLQDETQCEWEMKGVNLINFDETLDEYLYADGTRTFIIVDFMLDDDGSDGKPTSRVNIRYARKKGRCDTNRLWFYTGTGTVNHSSESFIYRILVA